MTVSAPRIFVTIPLKASTEVELDREDAHHVAHVLRAQAGARVVLVSGGVAWDAEIARVSKRGVRAVVIGRSAETSGELAVGVAVLQAMTKGAKFDEVVEKCVELGARRIVPVTCARSYAQAGAAKLERWRRIARAAAAQARRRIVPAVDPARTWSDAIENEALPILVAWEGAPAGSLDAAIAQIRNAQALSIAIGPEGSFTDDELDVARARGAYLVRLGPTILRTETAAAALLAALAAKEW